MLVVSPGCPAGIGPEVSVAAAARLRGIARVIVGDVGTLLAAARTVRLPEARFEIVDAPRADSRKIQLVRAGPELSARDRVPGKPSKRAGRAQLAWIDAAYDLVRSTPDSALVTGPVSKWAIARSGAAGAGEFRGHTEWLERRDGAGHSVMCFVAKRLSTSLVTTHLPLHEVADAIEPDGVSRATVELARLLSAAGVERPRIAVASLNPHAGEGELLGDEERRAIVPGIRAARRRLRRGAEVVGPIGAETAYRRAAAGAYDGVVAMYHDQATIPMKLLAFGDAVNVTMGLSIVRTSVDHGTGYDIAWENRADRRGMRAAMRLAQRLLGANGL